MSNDKNESQKKKAKDYGITGITVCGYKSIANESHIEIQPLTILAGANSSGKSSIMQPLLLLKQTLDSTYDPGPLKLNGPNVQFTRGEQLLSRKVKKDCLNDFIVGLEINKQDNLILKFRNEKKRGFSIIEMEYKAPKDSITLRPGMKHNELISIIPNFIKEHYGPFEEKDKEKLVWEVAREYCFLVMIQRLKHKFRNYRSVSPTDLFARNIARIIHVPGLRGNPERNYPVTAVGPNFQGTFQNYVASVINHWKLSNSGKFNELSKSLNKLELTWKVDIDQINETTIEILVGRLPHSKVGGAKDLVSIADVGYGVSQSLPVLVSLLVARPGQLVYIEQPEIHLHPNAQVKLASILADAAMRGVRVVIETHSSLLLLAIQTLVAKNEIFPELITLNWFERGEDGITKVTAAKLDSEGAFGEWPENFDTVQLKAQKEYLKASMAL